MEEQQDLLIEGTEKVPATFFREEFVPRLHTSVASKTMTVYGGSILSEQELSGLEEWLISYINHSNEYLTIDKQ